MTYIMSTIITRFYRTATVTYKTDLPNICSRHLYISCKSRLFSNSTVFQQNDNDCSDPLQVLERLRNDTKKFLQKLRDTKQLDAKYIPLRSKKERGDGYTVSYYNISFHNYVINIFTSLMYNNIIQSYEIIFLYILFIIYKYVFIFYLFKWS